MSGYDQYGRGDKRPYDQSGNQSSSNQSNKYPRTDRDDRYASGSSYQSGAQPAQGYSSSGQQSSAGQYGDYRGSSSGAGSSRGYGSSASGYDNRYDDRYGASNSGQSASSGQGYSASSSYNQGSSSGSYGSSSGRSGNQPSSSSYGSSDYRSGGGSSSYGRDDYNRGSDYRSSGQSSSGGDRGYSSNDRGNSSSYGGSSDRGYGGSSSSYGASNDRSSSSYGGSSGSGGGQSSSYQSGGSSGGYGGSSSGGYGGSSGQSASNQGRSGGSSSFGGGSSFGGSSSGGGGGGAGVCRDFQRDGSCRFGATCKFSHDGAGGSSSGGGRPSGGGGGGGVCHSFKNTSSCRFGDTCKFSHDGAGGGGSSGGGSFGGGGFGGGFGGGNRGGYNAPGSPSSASTTSEVSLPSLDLGVANDSLDSVRRSRDEERAANALIPALTALDLTARKAPGSRGRPTTCVANMYEFRWKPQTVYQSLVVFPDHLPSDDPAARRVYYNKFKDQIDNHFSVASFDTSTIVSLESREEKTFTVDNGSGGFLSLTIRPLKSLDSSDTDSQEVQACINKLVKGLIRKMEVIQFNRAYYFPDAMPLEGSIQVYRGFQMVVSPLSSGFQLNVDLAHRVVHKRNVREQMNEIERRTKERMPTADPKDLWKAIIENVHSELRGSVVVTTYSKRCYRIDAIDYGKSPDSVLETKEGKTTFREYMKTRYGIDLPPGERRGMVVHFPRRGRQGSAEPLYFVPELLSVTGVSEKMKSDGRLMKKLADLTRLPAATRMGRIDEMIQKLLSIDAVRSEMMKSSVIINDKPTNIQTRILGPFDIQTKNQGNIQISAAKTSFQSEAKRFGFFEGRSLRNSNISSWCFMVDPEFGNMTERITGEIMKVARNQGLTLPRPLVFAVEPERRGRTTPSDWKRALESMLTRGRPDFVVFLNPYGDESIYAFMKGACIEAHGLVTQCLNTETVKNEKRFQAVIANTVVQICAKLGATPWRATVKDFLPESLVGENGVMIVGVDVEHEKAVGTAYENPSLGQSNNRSRSTVAFTATYDHPYHNSFNSFVAFQGPQTEICESAQEMMRRCLIAYSEKNQGKFPSSVYVYRDGVGDSQLKVFVHKEIKAFEAAFASLNIAPKLTVLVVQKKLSIRLFEQCPRYVDKSASCPQPRCSGLEQYHSPIPGTVADQTIVSKLLTEFFLVPTAAPNGATSRPTRFIVVRDDLNQSMDDMQSLTHCMTYLYFNWNGPIRVPAPVMYAHKLAFLFGKYINVTNIHQELGDKLFFL